MSNSRISIRLCAKARRDSFDNTTSSSDGKLPRGDHELEAESENASASEGEELAFESSYSALLHALKPDKASEASSRKRRKLSHKPVESRNNLTSNAAAIDLGRDPSEETSAVEDDLHEEDDDTSLGQDVTADAQSDDDNDGGTNRWDPFERHFAAVDERLLSSTIANVAKSDWQSTVVSIGEIRKTITVLHQDAPSLPSVRRLEDLRLKKRMLGQALEAFKDSDVLGKDLSAPLLYYRDVIFASRNLRNASYLRNLVSMHTLNHIFKTRDHIIKNNARISQDGEGTIDLRDQGFTRPKVLILLPTKQSCVRYVDSIVSLCQPEQQENKARFLESFIGDDEKTWDDKPEDFQELFSGNDDDMFRIGLKFTRKTIKYFSRFYKSDIILASPLGLRTAIEIGGGGKGKKKGHDADFLSSIEVVVVDQTSALLMQNWQHVEYIFSQLNHLPKESHGCDFSRTRTWYLDNHAKYLRQTVILSNFLTPEINSLSSTYMVNIAGMMKYVPTYKGVVADIPTTLPMEIKQTFSRFDSPSPTTDSDSRFRFFTSTILPSLLREKQSKGTVIFIPTYLDFTSLRNHFSTSTDAATLSFGAISEYTAVRDVARTRSHFGNGRHRLLLYTERAHHFRRYRFRGVKNIIFYGLPENPKFWREIVAFLALNLDDGDVSRGKQAAVRVLFSKWDFMKLERVVGTTRVGRLVGEKSGDTFDFV